MSQLSVYSQVQWASENCGPWSTLRPLSSLFSWPAFWTPGPCDLCFLTSLRYRSPERASSSPFGSCFLPFGHHRPLVPAVLSFFARPEFCIASFSFQSFRLAFNLVSLKNLSGCHFVILNQIHSELKCFVCKFNSFLLHLLVYINHHIFLVIWTQRTSLIPRFPFFRNDLSFYCILFLILLSCIFAAMKQF